LTPSFFRDSVYSENQITGLSKTACMIFKTNKVTKLHYYGHICVQVWFKYAHLAILPRMNFSNQGSNTEKGQNNCSIMADWQIINC